MVSDLILEVNELSKKYCRTSKRSVRYGISDIFKTFIGQPLQAELRQDEFWSVNNVTFSLSRGECLGIVGMNGAGKSTLLKLVSGILIPDKGRLITNGRVCSLLEVGSGLHQQLTGRENILIKGSILGLSKAEILRQFDSIVNFSGLEDSIDMPIKSYSSGMRSRLGFAVAAHVKPDLLILDEILAVGDMDFRVKCMNYIQKIREQTAILFVSHNMVQVKRICDRGMHIMHGRIASLGTTDEAIQSYEEEKIMQPTTKRHFSSYIAEFDVQGAESVSQFENLEVTISVTTKQPLDFHVNIIVFDQNGVTCLHAMSPELHSKPEGNKCQFSIAELLLRPGVYNVTVNIMDKMKAVRLATIANAFTFKISGELHELGIYTQKADWTVA